MADTDLLDQLRRYGDILATTAVAETDAPSGRFTSLGPRRRTRRLLAAVAAAVAVLVAVVAVSARHERTTVHAAAQPPRPAAPYAGPRYVTSAPPAGFAPMLIEEVSAGEAGDAMTVQAFDVQVGGGQVGRMQLVIEPTNEPAGAATDDRHAATIQGHPASLSEGVHHVWAWLPDHASIIAVGHGLDDGEMVDALNSLRPRGADALVGFDPPPATSAVQVQLVAENVARRSTPSPAASHVYYAQAGETRPRLVVEAVAPVAGQAVNLDLVGSDYAPERTEIAGQPRMVAVATGDNPWTTVTWFAPDGTMLTVDARDVTPDQLSQVVSGVTEASSSTWASTRQTASDFAARLPELSTHNWPAATLSLRAAGVNPLNPSEPGIGAVCLTPAGATAPTCVTMSSIRDFGPSVFGPAGWSPRHIVEGTEFSASVLIDVDWWVFGGHSYVDSITLSVRDALIQPVDTAITPNGLLFAARIPPNLDAITVEYHLTSTNSDSSSTNNSTISVSLARPKE